MKIFFSHHLIICLSFLLIAHVVYGYPKHYDFVVKEVSYTRLCDTKKILTVNGKFPGPTISAYKGDTITVDIINKSPYNITIHWHGVKQPRSPWYDGPEYITQCPIQPGKRFKQKIVLSDEEGTLWWHAHSEYARATVHGPLIVYPQQGQTYPFAKPSGEVPIILGEWWKGDIQELYEEFTTSGGDPDISDALTINGQPGDLYNCSTAGTFTMSVKYGKTYLLRIIHAGMSELNFFGIANHTLTVVGSDGSYVKPFTGDYITISPGQTIDVLLTANQTLNHYYMAAKVYNGAANSIDNTTTTAILKYVGNYNATATPASPDLPEYQNVTASTHFNFKLRSLEDNVDVPKKIDYKLTYVLSVNMLACNSCSAPFRLSSSINNQSFVLPTRDILDAYYYSENGVFGTKFPSTPPVVFNYTSDNLPAYLVTPKQTTQVRVVKYNKTVEIVFQGTNLLGGSEHPMHLHGASFYVVGWGLGNFDSGTDPANYNLVDPPLMNTIAVPVNGWTTIRFKASNPGVWFMHCHFDRHGAWGMDTAFIVKGGNSNDTKIISRPDDMPTC